MQKKYSTKEILSVLSGLALDNLPELLQLIPIVGVPLSAAEKLTIGGIKEFGAVDQRKEIENQLSEIRNVLDNGRLSEEELIDMVQDNVLEALKGKRAKCINMKGAIFTAEHIDSAARTIINNILNDPGEYGNDTIWKFMRTYFPEKRHLQQGSDYYFMRNALILRYNDEFTRIASENFYLTDEKSVLEFAGALNKAILRENSRRNIQDQVNILDEYEIY